MSGTDDETKSWAARFANQPTPVVELVTICLRLAQCEQSRTTAELNTAERSAEIADLEQRLDVVMERATVHGRAETLSATLIGDIVVELDRSGLGAGTTALILARVIDAYLGSTFIDFFIDTSRRLRPGDPFPVVPWPSVRLDDEANERAIASLGKRTGNPDTRTPPDDRVDHLRLATEDVSRWCITLRWADPFLEPVMDSTRFAACVTSTTLEEFAYDVYTVGPRSVFYDVRPTAEEAHLERILTGLNHARAQSASIVVLPELAMTPSMLDHLRSTDAFAGLDLVVAGSVHTAVPKLQPGHNVATVLAAGQSLHEHRKFSDFYIRRGEDGTQVHEHLERDGARDGFSLLISPHCVLVVLTCKDAMDRRVKSLVAHLAPTLLLIPAMSPQVDEFERLAEDLAHDPQTFTVVACIGSSQGAIFGRPGKPARSRVEITAPSTVVWDLSGRHQVFEM